ncbi:clathrin adaptor, mu subunit [Ramicandelaber brevisporus]|nr:clathrin adaptor, mu subunit [Ramicandelaber brevisporus]
MTILAIALTTKDGKVLLSRQFVEIPRSRIEALVGSFPKLVAASRPSSSSLSSSSSSNGSSSNKRTSLETDSVRYLYQVLDKNVYLVFVTTLHSNIIHDMTVVETVSGVVLDICQPPDEQAILIHGFELLCALDEVVSLGHSEKITRSSIRDILLMESAEENRQLEAQRLKELEAKEELKRKAKMFDQQRREQQRLAAQSGHGGGGPGLAGLAGTIAKFGSSIQSSGAGFGSDYHGVPTNDYIEGPGSGSSGGGISPSPDIYAAPSTSSGARGMKLGRKTKDSAAQPAAEAIAEATQRMSLGERPQPSSTAAAAAVSAPAQPSEPVTVSVEEMISAITHHDGGLEKFEVTGNLTVVVNDADYGHLAINLGQLADPAIQIKTHPNVDKNAYNSRNILTLRDASKSLPVNQPVGLLKWRLVADSESAIPLAITCWPTVNSDGTTEVIAEYELTNAALEFSDVVITIPLPAGTQQQPSVSSVDGNYEFNRQRGALEWHIPFIDSGNANGTIEFTFRANDAAAFFPVQVDFVCTRSFCGVNVASVVSSIDGTPVSFAKNVTLLPDKYGVQ